MEGDSLHLIVYYNQRALRASYPTRAHRIIVICKKYTGLRINDEMIEVSPCRSVCV